MMKHKDTGNPNTDNLHGIEVCEAKNGKCETRKDSPLCRKTPKCLFKLNEKAQSIIRDFHAS